MSEEKKGRSYYEVFSKSLCLKYVITFTDEIEDVSGRVLPLLPLLNGFHSSMPFASRQVVIPRNVIDASPFLFLVFGGAARKGRKGEQVPLSTTSDHLTSLS